jgi:hypothetical protein
MLLAIRNEGDGERGVLEELCGTKFGIAEEDEVRIRGLVIPICDHH